MIFVYNDESIQLNFYMPPCLQEEIDKVEEALKAGDDLAFQGAMEYVEVFAKACAADGSISQPDMALIKKKYGGWG